MSAVGAISPPIDLGPALPVESGVRPAPARGAGEVSFEGVLRDALERVNDTARAAGERSQALAAGSVDDLHGTMIAVREASIQVRLAGTVRNRLLDAFHELWRTSV